MVYVLNVDSKPLMPCKEAKARKLLKQNKAKIVTYTPFTIQLLFECENQTQDIILGVDAGSKYVGLSAVSDTKEVYSGVVELRNDIVGLLADRKMCRKTRRNRKTRYRKARFMNRVKTKKKGWLAPSIRHKIQTHMTVIDKVQKILPITKIIVEVGQFDIQKLNNPDISGVEYQQGEQLGFWNVREYVLFRDNHTCQHCKGKSGDKILNIHHIESRKTGGDVPNNLITLCETCHKKYHDGLIKLNIKRGQSYRDAAFMGIMRWAFYEHLKELYPDVKMTYGYITKNTRINAGLPKEHYIDARCITGKPLVELLGYYFYQKKVRCHNRQLHKMTINKGGTRKNNQCPYKVFGFRLYDKVLYDGQEWFIWGRRARGSFKIAKLSGEKIGGKTYKKLRFVENRKYFLTERREQEV